MAAIPWTIFLGAFLLFQVQPIVAKAILPWFGGSVAVWTACMLFFQVALLAGYAYAHGSVRYLGPRRQCWVHLGLLALSALLLPIALDPGWKAAVGSDPTWRILGLLATSVGLPFVMVSATSPLLQAWYAERVAGASAYRLYSLSNAASLLALLAYPTVVEPRLSCGAQARIWSIGYGVFCLLSAPCALAAARPGRNTPARAETAAAGGRTGPAAAPSRGLCVFWLALAACASTLLLAVTNQLCLEIAVVPFLWILPLSLYLLSFILCFASDRLYRRSWFFGLLFLALPVMTLVICVGLVLGVLTSVVLLCAGLFTCCMVCHGELARSRPHPRYLTLFYMLCALGGALGGVFVGLVAPRIFSGTLELDVAMVGCTLLAIGAARRDPGPAVWHPRARRALLTASGCGITLMAILLWLHVHGADVTARFRGRNFYGTLRVFDGVTLGGKEHVRTLVLASIIHGQQFLGDRRRREPLSYYGPQSGVGLALRRHPVPGGRRVGVLGLGTGTVATFGGPEDEVCFYEINPLVEEVARTEFSYLRDSRAHVRIVPGDARLSLEAEPDQGFDLIVADIFSGDSIPMHFLTLEAFRLYFRHLKADGVLALNVSNRYINLRPVISALAQALGKAVRGVDTPSDRPNGLVQAEWLLVTSNREFLDDPEIVHAARRLPEGPSGLRLWTDDYSNLLAILR